MSQDFREMDNWSKEEIEHFKQQARSPRPEGELRALGPEIGTLVAEGDSWFDYLPGTDIIDCLRSHYGYEIINYAQAGDTLENMVYGTKINRRFEPVRPSILDVLARLDELKPKVLLFSGGGNDVAGDEFESYLNHKLSGLPYLRQQYLTDMVQTVFRQCLADLIAKVAQVSPDTYILMHGYGRTLPTGEGVNVLAFTFAGPWLLPALARNRILDAGEQRQAVFACIDMYNDMLHDLGQQFPKFKYIDLRDMLDPDHDWVNELHLYNSAYARVAQKFHETIGQLP
jgi:GDSL-like Lipase/Acylhydrolase family